MDVVKRTISLGLGVLTLLFLISTGFAQTPVPQRYSKEVKKYKEKRDRPLVTSNAKFSKGDVFAAVSNGQVQHYDSLGTLLGTLDTGLGGFTTGMAADSAGNLYVTNFTAASVSKFSGPDIPHIPSIAFTTDPASAVESILFDKSGNIYVGQADGTQDILKYDSLGNFLMRYDVAVEDRGSDWIDLAADQQTMYYTSEGITVKRYDVVNQVQLTDFATNLPGTVAYALRLLPGGGMLVADQDLIVRLDSTGVVTDTYDVPGEDTWFALNLAPDGKSFWSGNFSTGNFYRFDITTGVVLTGPINTGTGANTLFGLAVFGEIAVGAENPPTVSVSPPGPFLINEGDLLTFVVEAADPDEGDIITLDVLNLPPGATMTPPLPFSGPNTGISSTFNWVSAVQKFAPQSDFYEITYVVSDQTGRTDTARVQITVNSTPAINVTPPGPFVVNVGNPLTFDVMASDPDLNDLVTLDVMNLPGGATMTPSLPLTGLGIGVSSVFNWTPIMGQQDSTYTLTYTATDTNFATTSATVSISVIFNYPPVCQITPPGPFVISELDTLVFDVSATDPDPNDLIILDVLGVLPTGATMNPSLPLTGLGIGITSEFSWSPALGQAGTYTISYIVTDPAGALDTCTTEVLVKEAVFPPVCQVVPPGPFVIDPGEALTFDVSASDPNPNDVITLDVVGLPAGAAMTPALPYSGPGTGISSTFDWTPTDQQAGDYLLTYTVIDTSGFTDTCTVNITVNPPPQFAPVCVVDPAGPFTILSGNLLTFNVSASDSNENDLITLSVTGLPAGAIMDPTLPLTGTGLGISSDFSWTPVNSDYGNHLITYVVVDSSGLADTCAVSVTVDTVVISPPVCHITPAGPFTINVGDFLTFEVTASDPDTFDTITLDVTGLPSGATMTPPLPITGSPSGIMSTFDWTPVFGQAGDYTVKYTVTDLYGRSDSCIAQITVIQPNHAPVCTITPATSFIITEGDALTFEVTGTDPDPGDVLSLNLFTGNVLPPGATMTPSLPITGGSGLSSTFNWTPLYGQAGIYLLKYIVTDSSGLSAFNSVDIDVQQAPPDTTSPSCELTNINPGPPFTIEVTVQDTESGLNEINVLVSNNATVTVPPFTIGTREPVVVIAEKINQGNSATVVLEIKDVVGNTTQCDPVYQTISAIIPEGFALEQNFPNPFNPTTSIHFDVAAGNGGAVNVSLKIYDITGREVKTLVDDAMQPGKYSVEWDATNNRGNAVAGGIYLYRMVAGDFVSTKKFVLLK